MILLLNGAFGIGKTTVARALAARMPGSVLYDPEIIGIALQRLNRLGGRRVDDFQDLSLWRRLTVVGVRMARMRSPRVIVPMAISNTAYLDELRDGISRFEPHLFHLCLVAPKRIVQERLRQRGADPTSNKWEFRRAAECCDAHADRHFAIQVDTSNRTPDEIAGELLALSFDSVQ